MWYNQKKGDKKYFNPRPPRGGRPCKSDMIDYGKHISIHAPREGGDLALRYKATTSSFQSTPPARGATSWPPGCWLPLTFQSTPPARGATNDSPDVSGRYEISIHAPCEGGDSQISTMCWHSADFNPRPPRGGRPGRLRAASPGRVISIHAPREGATFSLRLGRQQTLISIHAPREGGDVLPPEMGGIFVAFQSTPPARGATPEQILEMSRNVQSGNTQNLKSMVIQRSFPKWSVAERRKTAAASNQAAVCACAHSRYFAGGSPSGLRV